MAYTPINWQTGDTITAEKMNKMDNGWGAQMVQVFSETVTTSENDGLISGELTYNGTIKAETIIVVFDSVEYTCRRIDAFGQYFYGGFSEEGPEFSEYPFALASGDAEIAINMIYTSTAGTHTVSVFAQGVEVGAYFIKAVEAAAPILKVIQNQTTWQEVFDAIEAGKFVTYTFYNGENNINLGYVIHAYVTSRMDYFVEYLYISGSSITRGSLLAVSADSPLQ